MKNFRSPFSLFILFIFVITACKKINEPTDLGRDLIPPVDNVNTFEKYLATITDNKLFNDSSYASFNDNVALGHINDPVFGETSADIYFSIARISYSLPVFDSLVTIDSVILSLTYKGAYGDTSVAQPPLSVTVHEIQGSSNPATRFHDSSFYQFDNPDFPVSGALGSKTFLPRNLSDSVRIVNKPGDTTKVANVLRIPLTNFNFLAEIGGIGDTAIKNDSALQARFKGLAVKTNNTGNTLAYFNPSEANSRLIVYYKGKVDGKDSALRSEFFHKYIDPGTFGVPLTVNPPNFRNGLANIIKRNPGGTPYASNSAPQVVDDVIYLQSGPNGSITTINLPELNNFENSVIHLAELIITKLPSAEENKFPPPGRLFLDRITELPDTALVFLNDFLNSDGLDFNRFGGTLKTDGTYRFNITRTVQGIVTRKEKNYTLRLHVPFKSVLTVPGSTAPLNLQVLNVPAAGRVVLAGGNYTPNPNMSMRLRLVYSKI